MWFWLLATGAGAATWWWLSQRASNGVVGAGGYPSWAPPAPPASADADPITAVDPRVLSAHAMGAGIECIGNPPPPDGWAYAPASAVTPGITALCSSILSDPGNYPMGSFVQAYVSDAGLVAVRIEWHNEVGATATMGCWRGANAMIQASDNPY